MTYSSYVLPQLVSHEQADGAGVNVMHQRQLLLGVPAGIKATTNRLHLWLGEPVIVVSLANWKALLALRICMVIGVGSEKEMVRTYAERGIAVMQYIQSFWDWAMGKLIGQAMSIEEFATSGNMRPHRDRSVSISARRAGPQPAPIRLFDLLPETISQTSTIGISGRVDLLHSPRIEALPAAKIVWIHFTRWLSNCRSASVAEYHSLASSNNCNIIIPLHRWGIWHV